MHRAWAVITDQTFGCQARMIDRLAWRYVPVYGYEFNDRRAPQDFLPPAGDKYGAYHASEIQFLFDIPKLPGTRPLDGAEIHLSDIMVKCWTNFARGASPAGPPAPAWSPYAKGADLLQSLLPGTAVSESDFARVHHCVFWAPVDQKTGGMNHSPSGHGQVRIVFAGRKVIKVFCSFFSKKACFPVPLHQTSRNGEAARAIGSWPWWLGRGAEHGGRERDPGLPDYRRRPRGSDRRAVPGALQPQLPAGR